MNIETLISASIQGGILAALVWTAVRLLPAMPPVAKVWLWRLVFVKFAIGLVGIANVPIPLLPAPPQQDLATVSAYDSGPVAAEAAQTTSVGPGQIASILWMTGLLAVTLYASAGVVRTVRLVRRATPIEDASAIELLAGLASQERLRTTPRLLVSDETKTAFLAWGLHPSIVLPATAVEGEDLPLVLAHELAHLANRDPLWNLFAAGVKGVFFFHPLVWLSAGRAQVAQESAADQRAVQMTGSSLKEYGEMLVRATVDARLGRNLSGVVAMAGSTRSLRERLDAMNRYAEKPHLAIRIATFAAVLLMLPGYCLVAQEPPATVPQSSGGAKVTAQAKPSSKKASSKPSRLKAYVWVKTANGGYYIPDPNQGKKPSANAKRRRKVKAKASRLVQGIAVPDPKVPARAPGPPQSSAPTTVPIIGAPTGGVATLAPQGIQAGTTAPPAAVAGGAPRISPQEVSVAGTGARIAPTPQGSAATGGRTIAPAAVAGRPSMISTQGVNAVGTGARIAPTPQAIAATGGRTIPPAAVAGRPALAPQGVSVAGSGPLTAPAPPGIRAKGVSVAGGAAVAPTSQGRAVSTIAPSRVRSTGVRARTIGVQGRTVSTPVAASPTVTIHSRPLSPGRTLQPTRVRPARRSIRPAKRSRHKPAKLQAGQA